MKLLEYFDLNKRRKKAYEENLPNITATVILEMKKRGYDVNEIMKFFLEL